MNPPPPQKSPKIFDRPTLNILSLAALTLTLTLYYFNPTNSTLYPRCPLFTITGWQCAGCGSLRALHSLLHGDIKAAWHYNPLLLLALPLLPVPLLWPTLFQKNATYWLLLCTLLLYTILRNL